MSATLRVLWPLAVLVLFLGTFRRAGGDAGAAHIRADPADVVQLVELADRHASDGRVDLAEAAYRQALGFDPHNGDVHTRLGELLLKRGDRQNAHAEAEAALRWHPGSARALDLAARSATSPQAMNDQ